LLFTVVCEYTKIISHYFLCHDLGLSGTTIPYNHNMTLNKQHLLFADSWGHCV